jgi:hypothetical protein
MGKSTLICKKTEHDQNEDQLTCETIDGETNFISNFSQIAINVGREWNLFKRRLI